MDCASTWCQKCVVCTVLLHLLQELSNAGAWHWSDLSVFVLVTRTHAECMNVDCFLDLLRTYFWWCQSFLQADWVLILVCMQACIGHHCTGFFDDATVSANWLSVSYLYSIMLWVIALVLMSEFLQINWVHLLYVFNHHVWVIISIYVTWSAILLVC
jgi:hypothetical protein